MAKLVIQGGNRLQGEVRISGAKNSALPIIVAAALAVEGECVLDNIPKNNDVGTICLILRSLGVDVWFDEDDKLHVVGATLREHQAPYDLVRKMRASFYTAGLLLARLGRAEVPFPVGVRLVQGLLISTFVVFRRWAPI